MRKILFWCKYEEKKSKSKGYDEDHKTTITQTY